MKKNKLNNKGFEKPELIVIIAVLAIIILIGINYFVIFSTKDKIITELSNKNLIASTAFDFPDAFAPTNISPFKMFSFTFVFANT